MIVSDTRETPINGTTKVGINNLLDDDNEFDDYRLPDPNNKPIPAGDTNQPIYKWGKKWIGIDHMRISVCQQDAAKLDGINKECIIVLTYFI